MATDKPGGWKHNTGANNPKPAATGPVASRKSWQPGAAAPKSTKTTKSRTGRFLLVGGLVALLIAAAVVVCES